MNVSIIRRILGYVLMLEAGLLLLPCLVALVYNEEEAATFIMVSAICLVCGAAIALKKPRETVFYLKEGCVATALSWIILSVFGCLPFFLSGWIPSFTDALFETVSGFTTTGASILSDVESLPKSMLFWRSFTHWIGGMGILVFLLAIVPLSGSNINLMRAESPGPSVSKLAPKMRRSATYLYVIYFALCVLELIFLVCGKMPFLDAMMITFGTAGTGGFGVKNDSLGSYSYYIQWVVTVFMILFGVNFSVYFLLLTRQFRRAFHIEEVRWYIGIILVCTGLFYYHLTTMGTTGLRALTDAAFQVASIITTTGFSSTDFNLWPQNATAVIMLLMFFGACAGSTGGGFKISRVIILIKSFFNEVDSYIHPKSIRRIKMDGKPVEHASVHSTVVYFVTAAAIFVVSFLILSFQDNDMPTNFTAVLSTLNNIGPGLSKVGPMENYQCFNNVSKLVLIFDMLAGRLELFPMLLAFNPALWLDTVKNGNKKIKKHIAK